MYIGFYSDVLTPNQITDYLMRVVQPKLQAVHGVQTAEILGGKNFALRAWLDPHKLAAYGLTATDVSQALANNDYISGLGNTKGQMVQVDLTAYTDLHSLDAVRKSCRSSRSTARIIRLKDVANVSLGSDDYDIARQLRRQAGASISASRSRRPPICSMSSTACARCCRGSRRNCRTA